MRTIFATCIGLSLCSCAWKSGVQQVGPDTYQTSANASPARGAGTGARKMALEQANEFCRSQGKTIEVIDEKSEYAYPVNRVVTITFKCR